MEKMLQVLYRVAKYHPCSPWRARYKDPVPRYVFVASGSCPADSGDRVMDRSEKAKIIKLRYDTVKKWKEGGGNGGGSCMVLTLDHAALFNVAYASSYQGPPRAMYNTIQYNNTAWVNPESATRLLNNQT